MTRTMMWGVAPEYCIMNMMSTLVRGKIDFIDVVGRSPRVFCMYMIDQMDQLSSLIEKKIPKYRNDAVAQRSKGFR